MRKSYLTMRSDSCISNYIPFYFENLDRCFMKRSCLDGRCWILLEWVDLGSSGSSGRAFMIFTWLSSLVARHCSRRSPMWGYFFATLDGLGAQSCRFLLKLYVYLQLREKKNNTFLENCQVIKRISPSCHDWIMLTLSLLMRLCESVRSVSVVVVKQRCELAPSCRRSGRERQAFRRVHHDEPVEVLQLCSVSADIGIVRWSIDLRHNIASS